MFNKNCAHVTKSSLCDKKSLDVGYKTGEIIVSLSQKKTTGSSAKL